MASFQRISILASSAAVAFAVACPAQAEETAAPVAIAPETTAPVVTLVEPATASPELAVTDLETTDVQTPVADTTADSLLLTAEDLIETESEVQTLDEYLANAALNADEPVATSAETLLTGAETAQVTEGTEVAQVTRPLYRGVAPFYLGVGGNVGIIDSGKSATGDFAFNLFGKVSLGPRFSVRPMFQVSETETNVTLPVTFNFNPLELGGFSLYPFLGGGVDFGSDIGLLINGGVDVPISRDFTFNSQINWRVTEDTGLGLAFGLGYNFPIFFE